MLPPEHYCHLRSSLAPCHSGGVWFVSSMMTEFRRLTFRRLTSSNAGETLTLQRAAFLSEAREYNTFEIPALQDALDEVIAETTGNSLAGALVGAFDGSRLVGSLRLTIDGGLGWISRVAVAPDQQGLGIGSALLAHTESVAPAPVREFRLAVAANSHHNIRLYARLGYTETAREYDPAGTQMSIMTKHRIPRVLLISGSTRSRSVNTAVLRTLAQLSQPHLTTSLYTSLADLPHFDPDVTDADLDPNVVAVRDAIGAARLLVFSTPEYAGALPGSFKNLLDWTVGAHEMFDKSASWINVSASLNGAAAAYASLANVLRYVDVTVVHDACRSIPLGHGAVDFDGFISDPHAIGELKEIIRALSMHLGV